MAFLQEFTHEEVVYYEEKLKQGVFIIPKPLSGCKEWYVIERNQQILFHKIKTLATALSVFIPVKEPLIRGVEGCWKEWTTLSCNQRQLYDALNCFKPYLSDDSTTIVGPGITANQPGFTSDQLHDYEEQLKKGVFIISTPLGGFQEWYVLERNQQILFHKIKSLAKAFSLVIPTDEPSTPGIEGGWKEWTTLSTNQQRLSVALDYLIAAKSNGRSHEKEEGKGQYLDEFTLDELDGYEKQLMEGVCIIREEVRDQQQWYILQRNQQSLFQKIQKIAEVFSLVIPVEQPSVPGIENSRKRWATLTTNQLRLSIAVDCLIAKAKDFQSTNNFVPVTVSPTSFRKPLLHEFPSDQVKYYAKQLSKGVFIIPKPLGNCLEWYILESNQRILFQKIERLAEVLMLVITFDQPLAAGENLGKERATLSNNQYCLSLALDYLLAKIQYFQQPLSPCLQHWTSCKGMPTKSCPMGTHFSTICLSFK